MDIERNKKRIKAMLPILKKLYPDARCRLAFSNPLELLVATILAAQCTDDKVNETTPTLFERYKTAEDYANLDQATLEKLVKSCGFYRNKSQSIRQASAQIVQEFGGKVPDTMDDLLKLRGISRKSANVLLGNVFGEPAIIVDTHMIRVSQRLGLAASKYPEKIEAQLAEVVPKRQWTSFSHMVAFHGRSLCVARKPKCEQCPLAPHCDYYPENVK